MPVASLAYTEQFVRIKFAAFVPEFTNAAAPLVSNCIPHKVAEPVKEAVTVPLIMTLGVMLAPCPEAIPSDPKAVKLTPAFKVIFSVYVPGLMNIVSPEDAADRADAIVEKSPFPSFATITPFAVE
jgi:hypothetical protein